MKTFGIILLILTIFAIGAGAILKLASPEHEHAYGEWTTKTPATCTEAGVEHRVCECNAEETRAIAATGHSYESVVTDPTCTAGGYTTYTCACGESYVADETDATAHKYDAVVTKPTCTAGGYTTYTCACGDSYVGDETAAAGHSYNIIVVTEPTCTAGGYTTYTCACGDSYVADETDATAHNYNAVVTEPTCTAGGYTTYTCACGDSYVGDETDAAGHSYDAVVTEPTCTAGGYTTYTCACGDSYVADETAMLAHKMVEASDATHHWLECSYNCGEATEKVAHSASAITASYNGLAMQYVVAEAKDFTVTGTCTCGKEFAVTEGIEVVNGTLALGENTVTVKVGDASVDVAINAAKFYQAVDGTIVADTHVNSSSNGTSYGDRTELYIYNTGMYRVFFKFNFTDALNSKYYAEFGDEAVVQFTFTVTNGVDLKELPITFKSYLTSDVRSNADFSDLTWGNYSKTYTLGWGTEEDPNNTVSLLAKETVGDRAIYADGKLVITVTLRELEGCIDENGNAIFVLLTAQKDVKPYVASMENTEFDIPAVKVIYSEDHAHAYIEQVVDEKYLASANCGETAKYYKSCSCGEASTATFEYGEVIEHSYGEFVETQAPTCTVEGINSKTCENCGDVQTEAIPVIAHGYNANVTAPTCTEAGYTTYTCSCGDTYTADQVPATGHTYGEWLYDESYHWQACACGDVANKATHEGGEATETEQAVCDTCKQPYGGLASHVHNHSASVTAPTCTEAGYTTYTCACGDVYTADEVAATGHTYGEWETVHPATCEGDEVLVHYCDCGESETGKGALAFGHDMQTKFDENNHWTECAHNCGKSTEAVAHFGGEATETEKAVCEGCGQSYGELKEAPKQQYIVNGTVLQDNYVNTSSNGTDYSHKKYLGTDANSVRSYLKIDFSDILKAVEEDGIAYSDAKIHIVLTACKNPDKSYVLNKFTSDATITFAGFIPGETTTGVDISNTENKAFTATNVKASDLYWSTDNSKLVTLLSGKKQSQEPDHIAISEDGLTLTITFTLQELMDQGLIGQDGLGIFTFRCGGMTDKVVVASLENTGAAVPAVKCEYYK